MRIELVAEELVGARQRRKLFRVGRKRFGKSPRCAGQHLLLVLAKRFLGLADKLAAGPRQDEGEQADE